MTTSETKTPTLPSKFQFSSHLGSSDSEDESPKKSLPIITCDNDDQDIGLVSDDLQPNVRPSKKLEIFDQKQQNPHNKFSIWSEILLEEQLTESMNDALKIKEKRRNRQNKLSKRKPPESEEYFSWTKEEFKEKFAPKTAKKRRRPKRNNIVLEISYKLKESRRDIIKKVLEVLGEEKTRRLVAEVLDIEDAGGIMTESQERRRSPGGVLFYLIKHDSTISDEDKNSIFSDGAIKQHTKNINRLKRQKRKNNDQINNNSHTKNKKKNKKKKKK